MLPPTFRSFENRVPVNNPFADGSEEGNGGMGGRNGDTRRRRFQLPAAYWMSLNQRLATGLGRTVSGITLQLRGDGIEALILGDANDVFHVITFTP